VHIWSFCGDLTTDFNPPVSINLSKSEVHSHTALEKLMRSVAKKSKAGKVKKLQISLEMEFSISDLKASK
jgi:hypothetical protein